MGRKPGLESSDVLVAVTTLSFDIAVLELFLPLVVGAQAVIVSRDVAIDGLQLMQILDDTQATIMQATPATWQMLIEAGWSGNSRLKILCGGEALPPNLAIQLLGRGKELWNLYGPTETTIWSTVSRVGKTTETVSIGYPIDNTQIYILDDNLQPVPIGVVGRLFIGGVGVARGYLNRPELTANRFVRDPFSISSDAMMYDTGDQARYEADGKIAFLGRADNQVKIRGYRVELGEIEAALVKHSSIRQAVVIASGDNTESKQLVAYLILDSEVKLAPAEEWREFLKEQLPDYMIPAAYMNMDEFPLTPNGKVDRQALPTPPTTRPILSSQFVEPSSPLEQQLSEIMALVLDIDRVGINDSFFDLGGNSLLATRLMFQVREVTQVQLPLRHLFADPTVRGLARAVEASLEAEGVPSKNGSGSIHFAAAVSVDGLNAEAFLEPTIEPGNLPKASILDPEHVLLTGATGFIGAFLLSDLLKMTSAHVHCLVRAKNSAEGNRRIRQNLDSYGLWNEEYKSRIVVHPGDLARPQMGLPPDDHDRLAKLVDVIYHNGALVNFIYSYEVHRSANVAGTKEVLKLASQHRLKAVHFVSTLSVLHTGTQENGNVYYEDVALDQVGVPMGGYAQSKWVAEKLMLEAGRRGFPVTIFRPGPVAGDSVRGTWNTADMMTNLARASIVIGAVPMLDVVVDIVPVDYVSSAIVALSLKDNSLGSVFHLSNPQPMPYQLLLDFLDEQGISLEKVTFDEWRARLLNLAEGMGDAHSAPFMPLLEETKEEQIYWPHFDCRNAISGLKDTSINCEPVGPNLIHTYMSYLKSIGFLPTSNSH
jgi:thioester reductase-like protein